jgi:uracil-DNA glycosylase
MNSNNPSAHIQQLILSVQSCQICESSLPLGPKPIFQIDRQAKILIAGQAPGLRAHETAVPFDDPSGDRLRHWLGVSKEVFYDAKKVAILPMGFCFPGTGKSGDLPPRPECAPIWRHQLLSILENVELTLVIGQYAQKWHLPDMKGNLTDKVRTWKSPATGVIALPHPSPRNNIWLKKNPWFEEQLIPDLQCAVKLALGPDEYTAKETQLNS